MSTIFKLRRDTASNWTSNNPVLADGELGFDKTNVYLKIGDGSTAWNSLGQFTQSEESIEDFIGGMVTGNTETFITVTYDDSDGTLDFVVPVLDEDNLATNSATHLATQQSIKAYVDAQVTAQDLDFQGDSGGALSIDLDSEVLDIAGGTGIDTIGSSNTLTVAIDSTVATLTGTQTLTNKTLTAPTITSGVLNTGVSGTAIKDEDNMSSDSATHLATQQSIKAYVDAQVTAQDLDIAGDSGTGAIDLDSETLTIAGTSNQITTAMSGNTLTVGLPDNVTIAGNLTVAGTQTTVSSTTVNVADPMLSLATNNGSADAVDIGFYGLYDTSGSQDLYSGLFRDANDSGKWKLFKDSQAEPTTTVNVSATGYATGTLVANLEGNVTGNVTGDLIGDVTGSIAGATANMTGLVTYGSLSDGTITVTAFVDEDNMSSNSATLIPTQQSVKAYVDAQVTAQDLDFQGDSGGALSIDLDSETLDIAGGTNITTAGSGNTITVNIDPIDEDNMASNSATQVPSQQSVKAYVDAQVTAQDLDFTADSGGTGSIDLDSETFGIGGSTGINTSVSGNNVQISVDFKDEDDMASDSAVHAATQQSIKAYVDAQVTAQDLDFQGDSGGALSIDLDSETLDIAGGTGVTTAGSGNTVTVNIGQDVATDANVQFANITATGNLNIQGSTTTITTTNTTITDSLIEYSTGTTGTPTNDSGIVIERGDAANAFIGFDESADKFTMGTGTFTGASTGNLSITTGTLVANIEAATVSATGNITVGGTVDGRDIDTDGTKLDTIETNADVTDAANVEAAGAVMESGANASAIIPSGTTAQRDGSPSAGFFRWNTTTAEAEIYTGSEWSLVGGGNITKEVNWEHESELATGTNYAMEDGNNAISAGPVTISTGASFTVGTGSVWAIV